MGEGSVVTSLRYPCEICPIRKMKIFRQFTAVELQFISRFKAGELSVQPRATILQEGSSSVHLFTMLQGWAFRYKTLADGRRQILNVALPGDFLGLQGSVFTEMTHSVEALTNTLLCVFQREQVWELYRNHPTLSFDITWLASREEQTLDQNLLNLGRRQAIERIAYLILHLHSRARALGLATRTRFSPPITQEHLADTLGMSIVHTNKTLRRLADRHLIRWKNKQLDILKLEALQELAQWEKDDDDIRPLI